MLALALAALAALLFSVDGRCPVGLEPLNKTVQVPNVAPPRARQSSVRRRADWIVESMDAQCEEALPGFETLRRNFLALGRRQRLELCNGTALLALGRHVGGGPIVWRGSPYLRAEEELDSTYLAVRMRADGNNDNAKEYVGSLDLATNTWRLVENETTFTCLLCQRAWVERLEALHDRRPHLRPPAFSHSYIVYLNETGADGTAATAARLLTARLNATRGLAVAVHQVPLDRISLGIRAPAMLLQPWVAAALDGSFAVAHWIDLDVCPPTTLHGLHFAATRRDSVRAVSLPNFRWATKLCTSRPLGRGDYAAIWDLYGAPAPPLYWFDREEHCLSRAAVALADRLERLGAASAARIDVLIVAEKTADVPTFTWPRHTFYRARHDVSARLLGVLSSLRAAAAPATYHHCHGDACAFVSAEVPRPDDPDTVMFTARDAPPTFVSSRAAGHVRLAFNVSITMPSALTSAGRVALSTLRGDDVANGAYFQPQRGGALGFRLAVVVHVVAAATLAERRRPIAVRVNNEAADDGNGRYFSVWSLGAGAETTQPCRFARRSGAIDDFECDAFADAGSGVIGGTFLAISGIRNSTDIYRVIRNLFRGYSESKVRESNETGGDPPSSPHVRILSSTLADDDPVVGFSLSALAGDYTVRNVTNAKRNEASDAAVDIVLGTYVFGLCDRLEILAANDFDHFYPVGSLGSLEAYNETQLMVVHVAITSRDPVDESASDALYIDIQLLEGEEGAGQDLAPGNLRSRFVVAAWMEADNAWSVTACVKRRSTRNSKLVFRCATQFVGHDFSGNYLIFRPFGFVDCLGSTLLGILIVAGVLSGVGLASIAVTAAALASWRQDLGKKILLQMTLALSFNLALGFTTSLVSVDSASAECVGIGALRHFSYLAMFAWMLVISGLQLHRLVLVFEQRTSNLLLKVSSFAWGAPTAIVITLLTFKREMYLSDVADRGFCYPEGAAFTWSVQVPAGAVLTLNALIFAVILARLYNLLGWGKVEGLSRHQDTRDHRLRAVFFTFCLFGVTWVFHLLAEQGVFQEKYLYEYLFLMTASVHVFSLSCMFVFFDPKTRADWLKVIEGPQVRAATWFSSVKDGVSTLRKAPKQDGDNQTWLPLKQRLSSASAAGEEKEGKESRVE